MGDQRDPNVATPETAAATSQRAAETTRGGTSRRDFLAAGAGLVAGGATAQMLPSTALAQEAGVTNVEAELRDLRGRPRILLKGGVVLTLDRQVGDFAQADVLVEGGKIREVRPNLPAPSDAAVVDATNMIVLPGFVDTHHHSYQAILRNILSDGLLADYSRDIVGVLTPAYQPEDAYISMLLSALGALDHGFTTIVDLSQVSHSPAYSDACIRGLQESGIRAVYAYSRGAGPEAQHPQDLRRIKQQFFSSDDQLLTLALQAGLTNTQAWPMARELGVPLVEHVVGGATPANAVLLELAASRQLGPDVEFIHCTGLSDDAWRAVVDGGVHVSLAVPIEMQMRHGMPPIQRALDAGLRPSLSSDVDTNMAQDPFTLMRSTYTLQRVMLNERALAGEDNLPPLLTVRDVLEFATIDGARGAHLDRKVGTLTPGKDADVVLLRTDRPGVWPLNNAVGAVVTLMDSSSVDAVFVAGQVRKWRGSLVGVDLPRVFRQAQESRDAVVRRSGFPTDLLA
jgi:cytosine/adenosine deaminase-related metal-dependent hydrolase